MTTKEALELSSTIELYEELAKRFDSVIFVGVQDRPREDNPINQNRLRQFKGNMHFCAGLCIDMASRMVKGVQAQEITLPLDGL